MRPSNRTRAVAEAPIDQPAPASISGRRRRPQPPPPNYIKMVAALVVILVLVGAVVSFPKFMRGYYLGRLDRAEGNAAIAAADDYLRYVKNNHVYVRYAISTNRGPVEAQIHMAEETKLFAGLMTIATRESTTPEQLTKVLSLGAKIYDPTVNQDDRLPMELNDWATKHENREVAIAAMQLVTALHSGQAPEILSAIARAPNQDPVRLSTALDCLATLTDSSNLNVAIGLLGSPAADQVVVHPQLREKITANSGSEHLESLVPVLTHPLVAVRALALQAMGGPRMTLSDSPANAARRQDLGEKISAKLTSETPPDELAAALKAARALRLSGARDAVLKLVAVKPSLSLPAEIDDKFMSETLGRFVFSDGDAARAASEDLIAKLTAALDDATSRHIATNALNTVTDKTFMVLRPALDKLAGYSKDPVCLAALKNLVGKTYNRPDIVKANGDDPLKWQAFLAKDRPRFDRYQEIQRWYVENKQFQRVSDGKALLGKNKDYIAEASTQIGAWRDDANFVPPLGLSMEQISNMANDLNMLGMSVRKAWSGALE